VKVYQVIRVLKGPQGLFGMAFPCAVFEHRADAERWAKDAERTIVAILSRPISDAEGAPTFGKMLSEIGVVGVGHTITDQETQGMVVQYDSKVIVARH
jgi:hypothetical protein